MDVLLKKGEKKVEFRFSINSQVINEWNFAGDIDATNAIILSLLSKYDNPHNGLEHDNEGRVWLNLDYILRQVPWLNLGEQALRKRLKRLHEIGALDRGVKRIQQGTKLYFRMSDLYRNMERWYDELRDIEGSGLPEEGLGERIEAHYKLKPVIISHRYEDTCGKTTPHRYEDTGAHRYEDTGNPNTNNHSTKGGEDISSKQEGENRKDDSTEEPPPAAPPSEKKKPTPGLFSSIEAAVEEDGAGPYYITDLTRQHLRGYAKSRGPEWVWEQFREYRESKPQSKVRGFLHVDFPEYLAKQDKQPPKSRSPATPPGVIMQCPVCGTSVVGTMKTCGGCGFDISQADSDEAILDHKAWLERRRSDDDTSSEFFSLFKRSPETSKAG